MALRTNYLPSGRPEMRFVEVDESMFKGVERPYEIIFCILGNQRNDLDEFGNVTFQVGEWPCGLIICLLDVLKCDFGEVDEAMFQGVERYGENFVFIMDIQKKGTWTNSRK
jgi:hypothetical protein